MNQIGDIIAVNRQNKQMTQEEFASRLGVTPQAVSKWERGQGFPDITLLEGICMVLSIDANMLLGLEVPKNVVENNDITMQMEILKNMIEEPLKIEFGTGLIQPFIDGLKSNFINEQRKKLVTEEGMLLPVLRIKDNIELQNNEYLIMAYDKVLVRRISDVATGDIFQTVILEVVKECKENYAYILNKQLVKSMMDNLKLMYPGEVEGIIPDRINYIVLLEIMKEVLKRKGNIRNQIKIVEIVELEYVIHGNKKISDIVDKILMQ